MYLKETDTQNGICMLMFTVALFTIAKTWYVYMCAHRYVIVLSHKNDGNLAICDNGFLRALC